MIESNLHTHTTFSDGVNSPEEMIEKAKELGFASLGFSDHSETLCDTSYCMASSDYDRYVEKIQELKKREESEIEILCGIEQDYLSEIDPEKYDYVIGAVHYVSYQDDIFSVDHTADEQERLISRLGGDPLEYAKRYYELVVENSIRNPFQIQGHFDLITKFGLFDDLGPAYEKIALEALWEVAKNVPYFEVNTGAISRGYRNEPYPAPFLLSALKECGAKLVLGSDCHQKDGLDCHFAESEKMLKQMGVSSLYRLRKDGFEKIDLNVD